MALQLVSPDPGEMLVGMLSARGAPSRPVEREPDPPSIRYVGGKPTSSAMEEVRKQVEADQKAGKLQGISGTAAGRAWLLGDD